VLTKAVCHVFLEKGLDFDDENPDIEVQYAFGIESAAKLKLKPIRHESDQLVDITPDNEDTATLLVNVRDLNNKLDVWRINASRTISGPLKNQDQINKELTDILADYPDGS
jgi:hypothetical protein